MKIHKEMQQKSWEWFTARAGKVTGSELKNLITDKLAIRKWSTDMPNSYLHRKLAEKWRGEALQSFFGNQQTDQGIMLEEEARRQFSSFLETEIETVGGIESDDGRCWCSPDGLIGDDLGLEIKCPNADTHVGWLLAGALPEEHMLQVQFALWVSGFPRWQFLSYVRDFPKLKVVVEPDHVAFGVIEAAVADFGTHMDEAFASLVEKYGPPPERKKFVPFSPTDPRKELFAGLEHLTA